MRTLIGIVAMTAERVIGNNGDLPWHLPADLKFFKKTTLNSPVVMGRKTFDSIGRPLPKRHNIVITRDERWSHPGVSVIHSPADLEKVECDSEIFIIGGGEVYDLFMPFMNELIVTHISDSFKGDAFFPEYVNSFPHVKIIQNDVDFTIKSHKRD